MDRKECIGRKTTVNTVAALARCYIVASLLEEKALLRSIGSQKEQRITIGTKGKRFDDNV